MDEKIIVVLVGLGLGALATGFYTFALVVFMLAVIPALVEHTGFSEFLCRLFPSK